MVVRLLQPKLDVELPGIRTDGSGKFDITYCKVISIRENKFAKRSDLIYL